MGTAVAAIATVVGTGMQIYGMQKQEAAQQKAEDARQQQMNLDMQRKRREAMRQAVLARSTALTNATAQGAQQGSGLAGGIAQITGSEYRNIDALNQDKYLGNQVFAANREYAQGQMWAGFGSSIANTSGAISRMSTPSGSVS
jgi:hypothetical protein